MVAAFASSSTVLLSGNALMTPEIIQPLPADALATLSTMAVASAQQATWCRSAQCFVAHLTVQQ